MMTLSTRRSLKRAPELESQKNPGDIPINDRRKFREEDEPAAPEPVAAPEPEPGVELDKARADAAAHLDDLQRLKAEFDNYRKRTLKEQSRLIEIASAGLVGRLISVLDHFELALDAAEGSRDFESMLDGIRLVFSEFTEVLRGEGLEPILAKGEKFDPELHEAAISNSGDGSGTHIVEEVMRSGYRFKGRVIRPAMVRVTEEGGIGQGPENE